MALCEYELERARRIADNQRRMQEMGLLKAAEDVQATASRRRRERPPPRPRAGRADCEHRRSGRLDGKVAVNYNEQVLDRCERQERRPSRLQERHDVTREEVYTEEHTKLLGSYKTEWPLFRDGYDVAGNRIYDKVNGMTCHQCRQKTLGKHTACSACNTLHGVFCGDCLFMRYGENVDEALAAGDWVCPPCRGLCNCSFHRIRCGWAPTGTLYRRAIAEGFKSVAHYLVLTKQGPAPGAAPSKHAETGATTLPMAADAKPAAAANPSSSNDGALASCHSAHGSAKAYADSEKILNPTAPQPRIDEVLPQSKVIGLARSKRKSGASSLAGTARGLGHLLKVSRKASAAADLPGGLDAGIAISTRLRSRKGRFCRGTLATRTRSRLTVNS